MNAHAAIDTETFANAIQGRTDDMRVADTFERRLRIKCIKEIIAEAEAKQAVIDRALDDDEALESDLESQLATVRARINNNRASWADTRVAIVKGHEELAQLAGQGRS